MKPSPNRCVYFASHGLGDLVMSLPTLSKLSECFRDNLCVAVKSDLEAGFLFYCLGISEENIIVINEFKKRGRLKGFLSLVKHLRSMSVGLCVSQYGVNTSLFSLLAFLSGAKKRLGFQGRGSWLLTYSVDAAICEHKIEKNYLVLKAIKENVDGVDSSFYEVLNRTSLYNYRLDYSYTFNLGSYIVIAPGSGEIEAHKRWPKEKYRKLVSGFLQQYSNVKVIVLGGPGESELCEYIANKAIYGDKVESFTKLQINEVYAVIEKSLLLVANCNGLSHLGAMAGAHVVGIYGPTDPSVTGPYTDRLHVVSRNLECSPCYKRGFITGCGNPVCMEEISVKEVLAAVRGIITPTALK